MKSLLAPKSMAIVGVSDRPTSFGGITAQTSLQTSISDHTYFINPKRDELFGKKVYHSLEELPEVPECIVICLPKTAVLPTLETAGKLGSKAAVVFASGFSEEHAPASKQLEKDLVATAKKYDMQVMGPNCGGYVNNVNALSAWGLESEFEFGSRGTGLGIVSNSGAMAIVFANLPYLKLSYAISCGNANATTVEDYFEFLINDDDTQVVASYLEGLKNPVKFIECLKLAGKKRKPVVILKGGTSAKGAISTASHTGSMAGSAASFESIAKRFGVILVDSLEELLVVCQTLSNLKGNYPKQGRYVAFCTSGADATISADMAERVGVDMPDFAEDIAKRLSDNLPGFAVAKNPLDVTSDIGRDWEKANNLFKALQDADNVDAVLYHSDHVRENPSVYSNFVAAMLKGARDSGVNKPIFMLPNFSYTHNMESRKTLEALGVSFFSPGREGYEEVKKLTGFFEYKPGEHTMDVALPDTAPDPKNRVVLSEEDSKNELAAYGIPVPKQKNVKSEDELVKALSDIGFPVVLKINSPDIAHKTEAGGVKLNIQSVEDGKKAYAAILESCKAYKPDAKIDGVLVQQMVPAGVEMIVGVSSDPQFGPMLLVGMGGVFVEVFRDSALSPCPLGKEEALNMLQSLKSYKLLTGYRGSEPCDVDALADLMVKLSQYAAEHKNELLELDLNPVFVYPKGKGVVAADALIVRDKK